MNAELIKIRKNKELSVQVGDEDIKYYSNVIPERVYSLNMKKNELSNINNNPNSNIEDYVRNLAETVYIVLDMYCDFGVYPDYFYDNYFNINVEYYDLVRKGLMNGKIGIHDTPGFKERIPYMMEKGINGGNYKLNPTRVRDISEYYKEMTDFLHEHYLPCEVTTVDMCREMVSDIDTECYNCINSLGVENYIPYDVERLSRLLFQYIKFFATIGVNPKKYLDEVIEANKEKGKSK